MAVNKCIKYLTFLFNLLFWLSGCLILAVSIYLKVSKNNKVGNIGLPGVDLMIAIGAIIMILGFLGCCGAIRENRCMLLLFFIGLLIIFILLVAAGILGAYGKGKMDDLLNQSLQSLLPLSSQPADVQNDLHALEQQGKCCGLINGPQDWGNTAPSSCSCQDTTAPCTVYNGQNVYKTPCVQFLSNFMKQNLNIVLGIAFGIAVLMIFGMSFAMTLYCQIGKVASGPA